MSNSNLVNYIKISPHRTSPRQDNIKKITIHHMAGALTVKQCGDVFQTRQASANYGIDNDLNVGMYVEEKDRAWSTSNPDNDHQAINIELANDQTGGNWHVSDKVIAKCIELVVDICKRNNITMLNFTGDKRGNLTQHCYFEATACPGEYLKTKFKYIANEVNKRLNTGGSTYSGQFPKIPPRGYYLTGDGYSSYTAYKNEIKKLQQFLNWAINSQLEIDGCYGPMTTRAVTAFQRVVGVDTDGSYGPITESKAKTFRR